MASNKFYSGQIKRITLDGQRVLGLKDDVTEAVIPFIEFLSIDSLLHGEYVTIRYYVNDKPVRKENIEPYMYSYIAGYLRIAPHLITLDTFDLVEFLENNFGQFIYLDMTFNHVPSFR